MKETSEDEEERGDQVFFIWLTVITKTKMATADRLSKLLSISLAVVALVLVLSAFPSSAGEVVASHSVLQQKLPLASNLTSAPLCEFDGLPESRPEFLVTASAFNRMDFSEHPASSPYKTLEAALFVLLFFKLVSIGSLGFYYVTLN